MLAGAEVERRVLAHGGHRKVVAEPAQRELLPRAHVDGLVADRVLAVGGPRAGAHERPEARAVLRQARGVVEVRQTEVVAELVREDPDAAVFGLDRVVADPEARPRQVVAAELAVGGTLVVVEVRVPTVAPDGVAAERAAAGLFAFARMDESEVVDVAVGLVVDAVAVAVVPVDLVGEAEVEPGIVA